MGTVVDEDGCLRGREVAVAERGASESSQSGERETVRIHEYQAKECRCDDAVRDDVALHDAATPPASGPV